jgi:competence protein ComQ
MIDLDRDIVQHMNAIIDEYVQEAQLNELIKSFLSSKTQQDSVWSELTIYTHYMLGGSSPDIGRAAAATELVILASDIADDLQDRDHLDRPWMQCNEAYTLNAVLVMLIGFFGEWGTTMGGTLQGTALSEVSRILARSINGQQKDLNRSAKTVDDYLMMVQEKSGSLIRLACYMGYCSLPCSSEAIETINDLADCIGLIHQIQNDMNDILQFDIKNDLLDRKRTLPVLYLLEIEHESFKEIQSFYAGELEHDHFVNHKETFIQTLKDSGCLEYSQVVQNLCISKAEELLEKLDLKSPWKEKFRDIAYSGFVITPA